jgi:tetratricopeptide (TPR) repeat protein
MLKKALCAICLVLTLGSALLFSGCKDKDVKQAYKADKLKKSGGHDQAIALFSEVASKPGLSEEAVQFIQINFCQYYGNPGGEAKGLSKKDALSVARSCSDFYTNYPDRTSKGLGPFEMGLLFKQHGEYEKAIDLFIMAEEKQYYDPQKTNTIQREKTNCGNLYQNIMESAAKIPGEEGANGVEFARRNLEAKCHISVGLVVQ